MEARRVRLWSLHPRYLDRQGLVALWREALLCQAVLAGETRGYRSHPQLIRFRSHATPLGAIGAYLAGVLAEASSRGYSFDERRIRQSGRCGRIAVSQGQVRLEWERLLSKLAVRSRDLAEKWVGVSFPDCHPLFRVRPGGAEAWERLGQDDGPGRAG